MSNPQLQGERMNAFDVLEAVLDDDDEVLLAGSDDEFILDSDEEDEDNDDVTEVRKEKQLQK